MKKILFYNTFEISVPIWNWLFPFLDKNKIAPLAILSSGKYRNKKQSKINQFTHLVWVPKVFEENKMFSHLFYLLMTPFTILFKEADLNVFYTQPPFSLPLLCFFSRLARTPYIVHMMDYHPDLMMVSGRIKKTSFIYKWLDKINVKALKKAEKVIVLGSCMKNLFLSKGLKSESIELIPNISSIEEFKNQEVKRLVSFKKKYNVEDKLIILYAGNMGIAHEFQTLLNCVKDYKESIHFFFVGKGNRRKEIEQFLLENKTDNITLFSYLSNEEFEMVLEVSNIHFISLQNDFQGIMVPSKFYTSLAIGKPVIFEGNKSSEIAKVIKKFNCGLVVDHLDETKMHEKLNNLIDENVDLLKMGANAKKCYVENFNSDKFNEKYTSVIIQCLK